MEGSLRRLPWIFGAILLGLPAAGLAVWEDVGPVVSDPLRDAQGPSIADPVPSYLTPYVALSQHNGANYQVLGKMYLSNWMTLSTPLNMVTANQAFSPDIALSVDGTPYVVWLENPPMTEVWVKRYNGGAWQPVGSAANVYGQAAQSPRIAMASQTPYIVWIEPNGTTRHAVVAHYSGNWLVDSTSLNRFPNESAFSPDIQMAGLGTPIVTWSETLAGMGNQVYVKRHNGASFEFLPGSVSLNADPMHHAHRPRLAVSGDTPYVTWEELNGSYREVYVKYHNGTDWEFIGPPLNFNPTQDAYAPDIALLPGDTPVVTWCEYNGNTTQVYVRQFETAAVWNLLGSNLNVDISRAATNPDITVIGGEPYVVWEEITAGVRVIYCRRWRIHTPTFTPTPSVTATPTRTPTRTATPYATNTFTPTVSPTRTGTITVSPSPTTSPTWTGTVTVSPSPTASPTRTGTVTVSPSPTASPTFTATLTVSATNTVVIFTPSFTPTPSATPTITVSPTVSRTGTSTPTRTITLTWTVTSTLTPYDFTYTPTQTATPVATHTFTPIVTPGITSATATATFTPAVTSTPRLVLPSHSLPVVIRGNVYRPTQQPPLPIAVYLAEAQQIRIQVFTLRGKLVKTIVDETAAAGTFEAVWDGANREGQIVRSGVYLVLVETRQFREKRKVAVVR